MGYYTSVNNEKLRYRYYSAENQSLSHRLFIYVQGDGDLCVKQENFFDTIFKDYHDKTGDMYKVSGNWVFPEVLTHKYCARDQRLDGLGFSYRYKELKNLIKTLEHTYPKITEIYLIGYSAGPLVVLEVANQLRANKKIKGIMLGGFSYTKLEVFMSNFFLKHGDLRNGDDSYKRKIEIAKSIHAAFDSIKNECSPNKKTMYKVFPFAESDLSEQLAAKRTDNHYCEYNFVDLPKKMASLPSRLKILVLQGEKDAMHSVESAYNQYNHLLASGKLNSSLAIIPGVGHSFGYRVPQISEILFRWSNDLPLENP